MTDQAASHPGTRALAWGLAGLVLLVLAGALVLLAFNARVMAPSKIGAYGFATVAVVVYAGVGGLIAARVPGNAIGWLLTLEGLLLAVSMFLEQYGLRGLATAPGSLPEVRPVSAFGSSTQNLAVASLIVLVLLFPGHPGGSPLTFTAAALAAVLLQPVRVRAGQLADRLVYGRRATPYEVLSEFSGQIAGTYSTEDVLPRMARMLVEATGARRAEVWLRTAGSEQLEAAWPSANGSAHATAMAAIAAPDGPEQATAAPASGADASAPQTRESAGGRDDGIARAFVVEHQGERLGALRITSSPREPLTPAGERLVRDVAAQAGLVLRNVALIEDLRASRQRLVAAADEARRRLERNLHDGAQQRLVALRITLGLARQVAGSSPQEADELLAQTEQEAQDALEELRDLARGIYPPLLADLGLAAALEAQARKAALPVTVEAPDLGRYSQDVEAAVYFCVLEALQNAAKYAQAHQARVTLGHDGRALTFTVGDDGRGVDQAATPMGTGVQGMADRLAALGGTLRVTSAPGHGTQVTGRVPVAQDLPSRELVA
jgi:signal transduction histidine kinase